VVGVEVATEKNWTVLRFAIVIEEYCNARANGLNYQKPCYWFVKKTDSAQNCHWSEVRVTILGTMPKNAGFMKQYMYGHSDTFRHQAIPRRVRCRCNPRPYVFA